ncbi:MAG: twin-arginine translocase TatA/TatE family subunit [Acidobacteriota bacterium]
MFGSIGGPELILIFLVALLIFGPRKLPELGRTIGRGLAEFRRTANDLRSTLDSEVAELETSQRRKAAQPAPPEQARDGAGPADAGRARDETS